MIKCIIFLHLLFIGTLYGEEKVEQTKESVKKITEYAFVDIDANVKNTPVFLDNKEIGKTPIKAYRIEAGKELLFKASANKEYYSKDLLKKITLIKNTHKQINFKFQKAKAKLLLIGDKAHLFINNKFIKELNENNRVTEIDAGKNIEIYLEDKERFRTLFKDIKANQFYEISYTLIDIEKELKLLTTTIDDLMWEDTKHASGVQLDWMQAKIYCEDLNLAGMGGWEMPSLEQLKRLQSKYKDKMYHGHGKTFYWSRTTSQSENEIWDYSNVVNFDTGRVSTPIKELASGYVRCVKKLGDKTEVTEKEPKKREVIGDNNGFSEEIVPLMNTEDKKRKDNGLGYDPELTKDLDKYMLK